MLLIVIVVGHPEFRIVGNAGVGDMLAAIDVLRPTAVVLGPDDAGSADVSLAMLKAHRPLLPVAAIGGRGQQAVAYEPGAAPHVIAEVSPDMLLQMQRGFDD